MENLTCQGLKTLLSADQWAKFEKALWETDVINALWLLPKLEDDTWTNGVNARIKELRLENGLSQYDLANMLGVSQKDYWRYEKEGYSVSIQTLTKIALFYNVSLDWFSCSYPVRKPFYETEEPIRVNGYTLKELKEAKAKGMKYEPHDMIDFTKCESKE